MKCLSNSSLFLSTLVATGKIKHIDINNEPLATYSKIYNVKSTLSEMFSVSSRMACVESEIDYSILFKEFCIIKKTDVSFNVISFNGMSLIVRAWTATPIIADQMST